MAPASGQPTDNAPDIQQALDLAVQHHNAGDLAKAEGLYQQVLQADPRQPVALHLLGVIAHQEGKNDVAVDLITQALAIRPDYADAHNNLGNAFKELGKLDEALASYHKALAIRPDYADAHNNLGAAFKELGRLDEAVASYHKALAIKPDFAKAHNNLGNAFKELGKLDEAMASHNKALAIKPDFAEAHSNLGVALQDLGRPDEAVASYRKALDIKPDYAEAHDNLGFPLFALGQEKEGLNELEWRWQIPANVSILRDFPQPMWNKDADLNSRAILLWSEQGVGDTIQWASCLSQVVAQAGHCIVEVQPKLVSLLARSFPKAVVRAEDRSSQATNIDFHLPLGSLYHRLYPNIESPTEAYLIPEPGRVAFWKKRLAELGPGPYIGICWKSSLITPNRAPNYTRIEEWSPIFANRDVVFVNLQSSDHENDLAVAKRDFGVIVHTFDDLNLYDDLDDVAALSKALDVNITVETAGAAISAGVGTPTWVITWHQSSFNTFYGGSRGPSVTRFGRNTGETWDAVFETMAERLKLRNLE